MGPFLILLRLETHRDDGSSQREGEEGGAGHQSGSSGGRRRKRVWSLSHLCLLQRHLRPRHRPLREGDHLPRHRRDEGEGGQRRIVSIRRHVGSSGRRSALQRARNHGAAHQAESHRRQQDKDSWSWSSVCSQSSGSLRHEDRTHRGRHSDPVRLDQEEGRTPRSPSVNAPRFSDNKNIKPSKKKINPQKKKKKKKKKS